MSRNLPILLDACSRLPHSTRAMFGGHGLFAPNGGMFAAIVDEDRIILKFSDEAARTELVELGGEAWSYSGRDKPVTMREWILVPDAFYDDEEQMRTWAQRAHRLVPTKQSTQKPRASRRPSKARSSR